MSLICQLSLLFLVPSTLAPDPAVSNLTPAVPLRYTNYLTCLYTFINSVSTPMGEPRNPLCPNPSLSWPCSQTFIFTGGKSWQTPAGHLILFEVKRATNTVCLSTRPKFKVSTRSFTSLSYRYIYSSKAAVCGQPSTGLIPCGGEAQANNCLFTPRVNTLWELRALQFLILQHSWWTTSPGWLTNGEVALLKVSPCSHSHAINGNYLKHLEQPVDFV